MLSEVSKSIKATLYDRAVSPLSGMFILSWVICNWKLCLVLIFADYGVDQKISTISSQYINYNNNIIYPLLSTFILVFAYPIISIFPFRVWEWATSYKLKLKHNYSLQIPLTVEQSINLRQELQQEKSRLNGLFEEYKNRYDMEKTTSVELASQLEESKKKITLLQDLLKYDEVKKATIPDDAFTSAFTIQAWRDTITARLSQLPEGKKITMKELVPQEEWHKEPDGKRKAFGKEFKKMVDRGDFLGIVSIPEKTSANEQLYQKTL